jgi:hypothetical protein
MSDISIYHLITKAMDEHGANGLWNGNGPCGCGRDEMNPGDCLSVDCCLAKSKIATADDVDDCIEIGDTIYFPFRSNQRVDRAAQPLRSNELLDGIPSTGETK